VRSQGANCRGKRAGLDRGGSAVHLPWRNQPVRLGPWLLVTAALFSANTGRSELAPPTPEEYVRKLGGEARIVPAGQLEIDGQVIICGRRPTVINNQLDDYAAAFPGFLILNLKLLAKLSSTQVKLWIYSHECGHQFRGPDEETADCFAVQRGRRQRWLTPEGLEQVCLFIGPAKGDSMHFQGTERCAAMRRCYADPTVK
jgi:hypothetical protein